MDQQLNQLSELKGFVKGQVVDKQIWTDSLFSLRVSAPNISFQSGQFTKLALPDPDNPGKWIRKAYSFVSTAGAQQFDFLITLVPDGALTPLLNELNPGNDLWLAELCSGFLTLQEIPETANEVWFLSTGSGIGPFLSLMADPAFKTRFEKVVLVHGVRLEQELVYQQQISDLLRANPGWRYLPTVTRSPEFDGLKQRIPRLIESGKLEQAAGYQINPDSSFVYLCGNPAMVKEAQASLEQKGLTKHLRRKPGQFASENYW